MPNLIDLLKTYELSFLRILAERWGVPAKGADKRAFADSLAKCLMDEALFKEMFASLPTQSQEALKHLKQEDGQMPWARFERNYGSLRAMGPGKREREKPWYFPASTTEYLYYRAMIGRNFVRKEEELVEVAFLPSDFLAFLPEVPAKAPLRIQDRLVAEKAPSEEEVCDSGFEIVDDYCTLFAALRLGEAEKRLAKTGKPHHYWRCLRALGDDLGLLGRDGLPTDLARALLERPKAESAAWLASHWANTKAFNELRLTPSLRCEGSWRNAPLRTRRKVLSLLEGLTVNTWYRLSDFVTLMEEVDQDFLRQGADYDLWLIYSVPNGELIKGIDSWQNVEPHYLAFLIAQWMMHLGLTKTYLDKSGQLYFALKPVFHAMMQGTLDSAGVEKNEPLEVRPNGLILMTDQVAPIARYQIARFAEWLELGPRNYRYQLTPASLAMAAEAKLTIRQLTSLLRKYGRGATPPSLLKAFARFQEAGLEASLEKVTVLRLATPEMLQALKQTPAKTWLGDSLGPVTVIVKAGGMQKVQETLARLGYLSDFDLESME